MQYTQTLMHAVLYCKLVGLDNQALLLVLVRTQDGFWDWLEIKKDTQKPLEINASSPGEAVDALYQALSAATTIANLQAKCNSQSAQNN
jgi:hypothetical protein